MSMAYGWVISNEWALQKYKLTSACPQSFSDDTLDFVLRGMPGRWHCLLSTFLENPLE
jgi:hypothetical protein